MNIGIYLITDAIVSIVDERLRLPAETLLKGMQLEHYYEWLGHATRGEFSFSGPWAVLNWGPSGRFTTTDVIQISTTRARYIH